MQDSKIDNKFADIEKCNERTETLTNTNDSFVNASQIVKVEMHVDENEELRIKNEPDEMEDDDEDDDEEEDEDYIPEKRPRKLKITKRVKKVKVVKLLNNNPEIKKRKRNIFNCVVCEKNFTHHKRYWLHCKSHPNFTCYVCWKRFKTSELLEAHNTEEHPNQNYHCPQDGCDSDFSDCQKYILHKKDHHNIEKFLECTECEKSFSNYEQWDVSFKNSAFLF